MTVAAKTIASIMIRAVQASDRSRWRELWRDYCAFYGVSLAPAMTECTWKRIVQPGTGFAGFVAIRGGTVMGFAHVLEQENSWSVTPVAYLEDLFVDERARGAGIGALLMEHVIADARQRGCANLYWLTAETNAPARRLYDRFVEADGMIRYRIPLNPPA